MTLTRGRHVLAVANKRALALQTSMIVVMLFVIIEIIECAQKQK